MIVRVNVSSDREVSKCSQSRYAVSTSNSEKSEGEKKAAGHDGICSKELKVVADKIAWQLAILFNESLETGEIPSDFKVGNIIPIFKSGKKDVTAPENYRGISLTPLVSKVPKESCSTKFLPFCQTESCSASFNSDSKRRILAQISSLKLSMTSSKLVTRNSTQPPSALTCQGIRQSSA